MLRKCIVNFTFYWLHVSEWKRLQKTMYMYLWNDLHDYIWKKTNKQKILVVSCSVVTLSCIIIIPMCSYWFFSCYKSMLVMKDHLFLGQNMLHVLPESFGNLKSLRICMLSKNHLMWLPSNFGNLSSLEDLRLDDNEVNCSS